MEGEEMRKCCGAAAAARITRWIEEDIGLYDVVGLFSGQTNDTGTLILQERY